MTLNYERKSWGIQVMDQTDPKGMFQVVRAVLTEQEPEESFAKVLVDSPTPGGENL